VATVEGFNTKAEAEMIGRAAEWRTLHGKSFLGVEPNIAIGDLL
jgi:hypothetical protein